MFVIEDASARKSMSVWSNNDSYLPRAKPPPPLVIPKKEPKKPSNSSKTSLDSAGSRKSSLGGLFRGRSLAFRIKPERRVEQSMVEQPIVEPPTVEEPTMEEPAMEEPATTADAVGTLESVPDDESLDLDVEPSFVRPESPSIYSDSSESSMSNETIEVEEAPPQLICEWEPPASWTGPAEAILVDKEKRSTLVGGWSAKRRRAHSTSKAVVHDARPRSTRLSEDMGSIQFANIVKLEQGISVTRAQVVEIQCFKGWDEKPVADVVHQLRELKCK